MELKSKAVAKKLLQKKRVFKIQDRVLTVDSVGEAKKPQATTAKDDNKKTRGKSLGTKAIKMFSNLFGLFS